MNRTLAELKTVNDEFNGMRDLFHHLVADAGVDQDARIKLYASYNRFLAAKDAENFPEQVNQEELRA